jgi:general secretion pathway protein G
MKSLKSKITNRQSKGGFTLIEILLVVVIIGIIVGIAVPKMSGKIGMSLDVAARASLKSIETAIQNYEMEHLRLPDSLEDLTIVKDGKGPYLKPSEIVDPWSQKFVYSKPGSHNRGFDLSSKSPEGKEFNNWE